MICVRSVALGAIVLSWGLILTGCGGSIQAFQPPTRGPLVGTASSSAGALATTGDIEALASAAGISGDNLTCAKLTDGWIALSRATLAPLRTQIHSFRPNDYTALSAEVETFVTKSGDDIRAIEDPTIRHDWATAMIQGEDAVTSIKTDDATATLRAVKPFSRAVAKGLGDCVSLIDHRLRSSTRSNPAP